MIIESFDWVGMRNINLPIRLADVSLALSVPVHVDTEFNSVSGLVVSNTRRILSINETKTFLKTSHSIPAVSVTTCDVDC